MSLEEARQWLDSVEDEFALKPLGRSSVEPPSIVYHYTTAASLFGVLRSKRLWATDARFLNDAGESEAGIRRGRTIFRQKFWRSDKQSDQRFYRAARNFFNLPDESRNFIFSFSEKRDDLPQWRAYANDGLGFTIGVDTSCLKQASSSSTQFDFTKVSYNQNHLDARVRRAIRHIDACFEKYLTRDLEDELFLRAAAFFDVVIGTVSASYKHSSFQSETEWRLKSFVPGDELLEHVKVRERDGLLVPYIELDICDDDLLPIKEIGIGPGYANSEIEYPLKLLFEEAKISPEIYYADTSFRRAII